MKGQGFGVRAALQRSWWFIVVGVGATATLATALAVLEPSVDTREFVTSTALRATPYSHGGSFIDHSVVEAMEASADAEGSGASVAAYWP